MLEKLCSEMVKNDYTMQHITFSWRQADVNILLAVDGNKCADILMGLSGYDRNGNILSRLFSYHFERPCRSLFIPEEDYRFFIKIFDSLPTEKREGKGKAFEPFNLFSLIESHLPEHPTQAAANKLFSDMFPPEVIKSSVEDANKIYFMGTNDHLIDGRHVSAQNLAKALLYGTIEAYRFCATHNVSTRWTDKPRLSKDIAKWFASV